MDVVFSTRQSKIIIGVFLLIILGAMAYLDSFFAKNEMISTFQVSVPVEETDEAVVKNHNELNQLVPELENKLVDTDIIDGYLVETYREYEIYKDEEGVIIDIVPTSNFNYLKYKIE